MPRRGSEFPGSPHGERSVTRSAVPASPPSSPLAVSLDELIAQRFAHPALPPDDALTSASGAFQAPRRGRGQEADERRAYLPGDDPRHIDWKTSARLGSAHTRLYREERDPALSVVLDLRDSLFTGSRTLRARRAALHAAHRVWQAAHRGGRVALWVFDADGVHPSPSARGERAALPACFLIHERFAHRLGAVATHEAADIPTTADHRADDEADDTVNATTNVAPALGVLVDRLIAQGRELGGVELVTGLDDAALDPNAVPDLERVLHRLCLAAPVIVALVRDELECRALAPGRYRYRGAQGATLAQVDHRAGAALHDTLRERRTALEALCRRCGAGFDDVRLSHAARARPA